MRGPIAGKVVTFIGDGACNMPTSWIFAAAKLGFELRIAAPKVFQPSTEILRRAGGKIVITDNLNAAATGADMLYTDVWVSMGKEAETAERTKSFERLPNQSEAREVGEAGRAGHALSAGVSRQGN